MAVQRMRRAADSGVAQAVASVKQHQKFKKMLMFGMRSLSDFCNPQLQLFVENALDALNRNVLPSLVTALTNFGDDEDIIFSCSQILQAMARACIEESGDKAMSDKFIKEGGITAVELILHQCPQDDTVLEYCYTAIECVGTLKLLPEGGAGLIATICKSVRAVPSMPVAVASKVLVCLSFICTAPQGPAKMKEQDGMNILLQLCLSLPVEQSSITIVENALRSATAVADAKMLDDKCLDKVIQVIEKYKGSRMAVHRGSQIVKAIVSTATLQKSLADIQNCPAGSAEHKAAVNTLRSLSYISSVGEQLAKDGALGLIVDLIKNAIAQMGTHGDDMVDVISGAARILGAVAANRAYCEEVVSKDGLLHLVTALQGCVNHPACVGSIADAMTHLLQSGAGPFIKTNAIVVALPILYQLADKEEVAASMMNFVFSASQLSELQPYFVDNKIVEILCTCCQYHPENLAYHQNVIQVLNRFSSYVTNLAVVYEYGGLQGIAVSLSAHYKNDKYCLEALNLLLTFACTPDAQQYMKTGDVSITDTILELMLEHKENDAITGAAVKVLEILATEEDVNRNMKDLHRALHNAQENVEGAYRKLAAVTGLYQIARLRPSIVKSGIPKQIMQSVSEWIEGTNFEGRSKLTKAAMQSTVLASDDPVECKTMIATISELACINQVKRVIELEGSDDNFLMHCTVALCQLCSVERVYTPEQCVAIVESISKVMRKHVDIKSAETHCIEALSNFLQVTGKDGIEALLSTGALVGVVGYLSKIPMYLPCQIVGVGFLLACAKMDLRGLECLKQCNCYQLLRMLNRTHTKSRKLKGILGVLLTMIMPPDSFDAELTQLLLDIEKAMSSKDIVSVHTALTSINQLLVSKECIKIAARLNIATALSKACTWTLDNQKLADKVQILEPGDLTGKDLVDAIMFEIAQAVFNMSQNRIGLVYLTKQRAHLTSLAVFEYIKGPLTPVVEDTASTSLDSMTMLFTHDRSNVEDALKKDLLVKVCRSFSLFSECPNVIRSICKCLAAMCITPARVQKLIESSDFVSLSTKLVGMVEETEVTTKVNALKALAELLKIRSELLLEYFGGKTKLVSILFNIVEMYPEEARLIEMAVTCLVYFGPEIMRGRKDIPAILTNITKALNVNKNVAGTVLPLLNLLLNMAAPETKNILKGCGVMEVVSDVMMVHIDDEEITLAGGKLFGFLGAEAQIRALMRNVIDVVKMRQDNMAQQVDPMCIRLAMYLLSPLENRAEALCDTEEFLASLNTCMAYAADNKNLIANATLVSRRLGDAVYDNFEDQFGAWAIANANNLQQIIAILNSDYGTSNVKFLCHAYRVFCCCVVNTYVSDVMQAETENMLPRTLQLLDRYQGNVDVTHAILEFMLCLAKSPATESSPHRAGSKLVFTHCTQLNIDILSVVTDLMINHKQVDNVVIPAMQLIGELAVSGFFSVGESAVNAVLSAAERICIGDVSHQRKMAYIELVERLIGLLGPKDAYGSLENIIQMFNAGFLDRKSPQVLSAFAALVTAAASSGNVQNLHKVGAIKMLMELLEDRSLIDKDSLMAVLRALHTCVNARPAGAVAVLKDSVPKLIENAEDLLTGDTDCGMALCNLLLDSVKIEGVGRALAGMEPLMKLLHKLQMKAKDEKNKEMEDAVLQVLKGIANDQPKVRNCQSIYLYFEERRSEGKTLSLTQAVELTDDAQFLLKTMGTYGQKVLSYDDEDGKDHIYGSMAFELLYGLPENCQYLVEGGVLELQLNALSQQTHLNITNAVSAALCAGCLCPPLVAKLLGRRDCIPVIGSYLKRVHAGKGVVTSEAAEGAESIVDIVLINALLLVERTAINRRIYLSSDVIHTVVDIWNAYDAQKYHMTRLLRQIFRSLRKIVAEGHLDLMLKCNMVARIKHILATSTDYTLIPDALFLAGSMAVVKQIKTQICELGLLDGIVELMNRHVGNADSPNAIITNTCLALANACIGHRQATDRFLQLKGPELNVRILHEYREIYEITNGASILLCNMLYKNDSLKDLYGKQGAPAALVGCLRAYAGSNEKFAIRCIESLFKAISNLALYASNVVYFLEAGIEDSFRAWLNDLDPSFSDVQLKIGLQTLSNLVMDNREENMRKFSVVLPPVLKVLAQDRQDSKVALLLFDIMSSLCRQTDNSHTFLQGGGVELVIQTMRRVSYDAVTMTLGIHLLATQTSTPEGVQKLLELDVFSLLLNNLAFEEYTAELNDILIASLRCLRKLVTSAEMVYLFCSQDGLAAIISVSKKTQLQPAILIECLRLVLGMLSLTEPTEENGAPAWENIGMEKEDIDALLNVVCICGNIEVTQKMARLEKILFSLIGYFLSEGLGCEALVVNNFSALAEIYLANFANNLDLIMLMTVVLENVFTVPVDVRNNLLSKEMIKKYRDVVSSLPNKKLEEKTLYTRCQALVTALASTTDQKLESTGRFSFELSDWNVDPYPNGIHDLPESAKQALRTGGRVKGFIRDNPVRVGIRWRSTQDLNFLEWGPEEEEFPYRISVRRIRNIARGLRHPMLEAANAKEPRKVTNNNCFCILGSATEDFPEGFALPVKCKNVKERDAIVELMVQWRDAATYNY